MRLTLNSISHNYDASFNCFIVTLSEDLDAAETKYEEAKKELEATLAELNDI